MRLPSAKEVVSPLIDFLQPFLEPGTRVEADPFTVDPLLEFHQAPHQTFRCRGAAGDKDVHGNEFFDPLHHVVGSIKPSGAGAHTHGNDVLGFEHLVVDFAQDGGLFVSDRACHNHAIRLTRRKAHCLGPETCNVIKAREVGHHLNAAAGGTESVGPQGVAPAPGRYLFSCILQMVQQGAELAGEDLLLQTMALRLCSIRLPFQCSLFPDVSQPDTQYADKNHHLNKTEKAELLERSCPRQDKHAFNVKDDEKDCNQEKLY